jgi:hypothetical protein
MSNLVSLLDQWPTLGKRWLDSLRARRAINVTVPAPTRIQVVVWLAASLLFCGFAYTYFENFEVGMYHDDAVYIILARSAADTGRFSLSYVPFGSDAPSFPVGLPLLLTPLVKAFPGNLEALKLVPLAATLINIGLIFWGWPWLSRSTSRWTGVMVTLAYSLSPVTVGLALVVMSEAVFLTACLAAFLLAEQAGRAQADYKWAVYLGVAICSLVSFRTIGGVVVAAIILDLLLARGRQAMRPIGVMLASAVLTLTLVAALTPASLADVASPVARYSNEFSGIASGSGRTSEARPVPYPLIIFQWSYVHVFKDVREIIFPVGGGERENRFWTGLGLPFLSDSIGWLVGMLIILGTGQVLRREGGSAFGLAGVLYLVSILFWRWTGPRLLYPIFPQLLLGLLVGSDALVRWVARLAPDLRKTGWLPMAGMCTVLSIVAAAFCYRTFQLQPSKLHTGSLVNRTHWIRLYAEPDAILMSEIPFVDYLYSARRGVTIPQQQLFLRTEDQVLGFFRRNKIDYVVLTPPVTWQEAYSLDYGFRLRTLKQLLESLALKGVVNQVYASEAQGIRVYSVVKSP